jgi:hypothetical protein
MQVRKFWELETEIKVLQGPEDSLAKMATAPATLQRPSG